jgi:hypothetical protein
MKKKLKIIIITGIACLGFAIVYYLSSDNRHKAYYQTRALHALGFLDPDWTQENTENKTIFTSPTLLIDRPYKSMEGPAAIDYFTIDASKEELLWLTGFETQAQDLDKHKISTDFICHSNIDFVAMEHYGKWNITGGLHKGYPRLATVSNGITAYEFPEGFGFPIFSNEKLLVQTQVLNHNLKDSIFKLKHRFELSYAPHRNGMKPLMPIAAYVRIPMGSDLKKSPDDLPDAFCIPVDPEIHSEVDTKTQQILSSFWLIPKGKHTYRGAINDQLRIKDSLAVHMIVPHLHPFSETFKLFDKTTQTVLYECQVENYRDKIGLKNTPVYQNISGLMLYADHDYELVIETNNTSDRQEDMMASMFLYVYDQELDLKIKQYALANGL